MHTPIILLGCAALIVAVITYKSAFKDGVPTCDQYVLNTYLYLACSILLTCTLIPWIASSKSLMAGAKAVFTSWVYFLLFVLVELLVVFGIVILPKSAWPFKHILLGLHVIMLAFTLALIYSLVGGSVMVYALGVTLLLFGAISAMAWKFQDQLPGQFTWSFIWLMIAVFVVELCIMVLFPQSWAATAATILVTLFVGYITMVHTKRMILNAAKCTEPADYVRESISFFIDIQNLFIRVLRLMSRRR